MLLPIALWFITLIPEWESMRARSIRRRERAIRVLVGELSTRVAAQGERDSESEEAEVDASDAPGGQSAGGTASATAIQPPQVLPQGLNEIAKRYYQRVLARGEGIDWEEEREAQRALGIGEEEADGQGMRMRML